MKKTKNYIFIFLFLFIIAALTSAYSAQKTGIEITKNNNINVFYWLQPKFCIIQTGNFILLKGGILAFLFGSILPLRESKKVLLNFINILKAILLGNLAFLLTSILSICLFEIIIIPKGVNKYDMNCNILFQSIKMFIAVYIFLSFWAIMGHGLRLTFSSIPITVFIGISIQLIEIYGVFNYFQSPILKFLPTALSRQIVVYQFPFWENGSWANIKSVFCFASTPIIIDKYYHFVKVNYPWISCFLIWYILLAFLKPISKYILNCSTKDNTGTEC